MYKYYTNSIFIERFQILFCHYLSSRTCICNIAALTVREENLRAIHYYTFFSAYCCSVLFYFSLKIQFPILSVLLEPCSMHAKLRGSPTSI